MSYYKNNPPPSTQQTYTPIIGVLNPIATLDCHISPHQQAHKFSINLHPITAIYNIINKRVQSAFSLLVSTTYQLKVKQTTVFLPQALLTGNEHIIHEYKKVLQKARIQSYIKLNIRHQQVSRQKKHHHHQSLNEKKTQLTDSRINNNQHIDIINIKNKLQQTHNSEQKNQSTIRKLAQSLHVKYNNTDKRPSDQQPLYREQQNKPTIFNKSTIAPANNFTSLQHLQEIHHHHSLYHKKVKKSTKKTTQNNPFQGIKINYIEVKSHKDNPEMSTFIYPGKVKSTRDKTNSYIGNGSMIKTEIDKLNDNNNQLFIQSSPYKGKSPLKVYNNQLGPNGFQIDRKSVQSQVIKQKLPIDDFSQFFGDTLKKSQFTFDQQINGLGFVGTHRNLGKKARMGY